MSNDEVVISEDGVCIHSFELTAKENKRFHQKRFALGVCSLGVDNPYLKAGELNERK